MQFNPKDAKDEGRADFPRLELKEKETARIAIFQNQGWEATLRHFVKGVGYVHCHAMAGAKDVVDLLKLDENGGDPTKCVMCKMAVEKGTEYVSFPMRRFAIRILRYQTDMSGRIVGNDIRYQMLIWILDNYKYRQLRQIDQEWGDVRSHDLMVTCEGEKYQKYTINIAKEALWTRETFKAKVAEYLKAEMPRYILADCLGQTLTQEVLTRKFDAVQRRSTPAGSSVDVGAKDVFAGGGESGKMSDKEVDDIFGAPAGDNAFSPADLAAATAKPETTEVNILDSLGLEGLGK